MGGATWDPRNNTMVGPQDFSLSYGSQICFWRNWQPRTSHRGKQKKPQQKSSLSSQRTQKKGLAKKKMFIQWLFDSGQTPQEEHRLHLWRQRLRESLDLHPYQAIMGHSYLPILQGWCWRRPNRVLGLCPCWVGRHPDSAMSTKTMWKAWISIPALR